MKDSPGMFVDWRVVGSQIGDVREVMTPAGGRVVLKKGGGFLCPKWGSGLVLSWKKPRPERQRPKGKSWWVTNLSHGQDTSL